MADAVHKAQASTEVVFGLSISTPPLCEETLRRLAHIGIEFAFNVPFCPISEIDPPIQWEKGVLFLTNLNQKEEVLQKLLELCTLRPSKLIIIDGNN
jgi:hypothetical protein